MEIPTGGIDNRKVVDGGEGLGHPKATLSCIGDAAQLHGKTFSMLYVSPGAHTWFVKTTHAIGVPLPSEIWSLNVFVNYFLPITQK